MRKFFFSLIGVLLLSTSAFASDVLFKMVATSPSAVTCSNEEKDLSPYALVVGGEATIGTTGENKSLVVMQSSVPYVRLDGGYMHVTLPRALKEGDVIRFTTYNDETKTIYLTNTSSRAHWGTSPDDNAISPNADFAVTKTFATSAGRMNNSKELYFHYGSGNGTYVKSLTITSSDNTDVTDYFFDGLDETTYANGTTNIFNGDIVVHSSGGSTIQAVRGVNMFYTNGAGTSRYLDLTVTQPSTVEVYSVGSVVGRKLHVSNDNSSNSALTKEGTAVVTITDDNKNLMTKGVCEYNSFTTGHLYISPSEGSWNIAAIRVIAKTSDMPVISASTGTISDVSSKTKALWTSKSGSITLALDDASSDNTIANTSDGNNFTIDPSKGIRLAASKTYRVSVPSNKRIITAYIEGFTQTSEQTDGKLKINSGSWSDGMPNYNSGNAPAVFMETINANSFTIETNSRNALVEIKLLTEDLGYYPVTISNNWASFCAPEDVELPSGVYAYVASSKTEGDDATLTINKVESSTIPANTGVLLYSDVDGDYNLTTTTGASAIEGTNLLVGTVVRTANPSTTSETGTTYSLYDTGEEIVFARYIGAYIPANKAYLDLRGSGAAGAPKRFRVQVGPAQVPTGVEAVESQEPMANSQKLLINGQLVIIRDGVKYNVQGQIIK